MTLADATRLELEAMWILNIRRLANIRARARSSEGCNKQRSASGRNELAAEVG